MALDLAWLLVVLPLAAFVLIVFFGRGLPGQGAILGVVAAGLALALLVLLVLTFQNEGAGGFEVAWLAWAAFSIPLGMQVDALTLVMLGIVISVSFLVQVYSLGYMAGEPRHGWFFAVVSLFTAAMIGLVLADNFLVLYVAWELVGLCSYLLIGYWYERPAAAAAAKKAFITTRVGDLGLLIGILLLFRATGTFSMSETFALVQQGALSEPFLTAIALLILAGAAGKSAQVPFHVWLPDAMEGPTPVSALIHAATMVAAGVYLVARAMPLFEPAPIALFVVALIGLLSALLAGILALVEQDMKRVLAYSTISQLGFMFMALGSLGYTGGVFHLFTHAYFKALLFLAAGSVLHALATQDLAKMGGLLRRMPWTAATFLVGALALAGVPPLAGFWSKDEVMHAVLTHQSPLFSLFALIAVALTGLYVARVALLAFFGSPRSTEAEHAHESPAILIVPLLILAFGAAFAGLLAPLGIVGATLYREHPELFAFNLGVAGLSTLAALAGLALGWLIYGAKTLDPTTIAARFGPLYRWATHKFYLDDAYQAMVDGIVLALARFVALFDRRVVNDFAVDGSGTVTVATGQQLRYIETGKLYHYALGMALGVMAITVVVLLIA